MSERSSQLPPRFLPYQPSHQEVDGLIEQARQHPLGLEYLREGALESVAATFRAHAFTVVDARARLTAERA